MYVIMNYDRPHENWGSGWWETINLLCLALHMEQRLYGMPVLHVKTYDIYLSAMVSPFLDFFANVHCRYCTENHYIQHSMWASSPHETHSYFTFSAHTYINIKWLLKCYSVLHQNQIYLLQYLWQTGLDSIFYSKLVNRDARMHHSRTTANHL